MINLSVPFELHDTDVLFSFVLNVVGVYGFLTLLLVGIWVIDWGIEVKLNIFSNIVEDNWLLI